MGVTLPSPLYALYQGELSLSTVEVTALFATYPIGVLVVLVVAGGWSDALGRRMCLLIALMASATSSLAFLLSHGLPLLFAGRALTGIASGFVVAAANAALIELAPTGRGRYASTVSSFINQLGLGLGALVAGLAADHLRAPTRIPFALHMVVVAGGLAALAFVPETSPQQARPSLSPIALGLPSIGRDKALAAYAAGFAAFAFCGLVASLAPVLVPATLGTESRTAIGLAVFLIFCFSAASQPAWSLLASRRLLVSSLTTLLGSLVILAAAVTAASGWLFFIALGVGGVGVGGVFMGSLGAINELAPRSELGRTSSTYFVATFAGLVIPVIATGWVIDRMGLRAGTLVFCIVIACIIGLCLALANSFRLPHR